LKVEVSEAGVRMPRCPIGSEPTRGGVLMGERERVGGNRVASARPGEGA
jgi:hypothetical protein